MKTPIRRLCVVLLAGCAGAGAALLLAPYSGKKTRRLIRLRAESVTRDLQEEIRTNAAILQKMGMIKAKRALGRLGKNFQAKAA